MATAGGAPAASLSDRALETWLFQEGYVFDFFQAVRVLERLTPERKLVGGANDPREEIVRFRARLSLDFPPSAIYEIAKPPPELPVPGMTVAFMGLTGPSGVLPRHYTELLLRLEREAKGREKRALREWLDLFNHRLISLFYRAWDKYRFYRAFERGEFARPQPDAFTLCLFSLMGLGAPSLRNRLRITAPAPAETAPGALEHGRSKLLGRIEDLSLLRYSGFFAHRPRNAASLAAMLTAYLRLPVEVIQFQGQWLRLEPTNCTALGSEARNNAMGMNVIVGDRIWDVQSKIRIRLGPLTYTQFEAFLPDPTPVPERKAAYLLAQLVRLYVGPELDVEFQLILRKEEVPSCRFGPAKTGIGSRLGWNTWSRRKPKEWDAGEAVFQAQEFLTSRRVALPAPGAGPIITVAQ
jgi:type VI secretion system protein ImpH